MPLGLTPFRFALRIASSIIVSAISIVVWYFIPSQLYGGLGQAVSIPQPDFLLYAGPITVLAALSTILKGHPIGAAAGASAGLVSALYLYILANGGVLVLNIPQLNLAITLKFQTIVYLLMLPAFLSVVTNVWKLVHASATVETKTEETITP